MLSGMDWSALRAVFRKERETRVGSRAKLSERASTKADDELDESTVYRIETDPDYMPGLDTFVRLIEAMPNLTLTEFFARVEGVSTAVENESGAQSELDPLAHEIAMELGRDLAVVLDQHGKNLAGVLDKHVRALRRGESPRARTQGARTKSAPTRHRPSGPRKTGT